MTREQEAFIETMTPALAARFLAKFDSPENALARGEGCLVAFNVAWEMCHPGTYYQRQRLASGTQFYFIDMRDGDEV